jgi:competence protein ComFC
MTPALSTIADAFVSFVYPPACSTCWRNLSRDEFYICHNCWDGFERVAPTETIIQTIEAKFLSDRSIDKIDSVFLFEQDPLVRMAIHLLKYSGAERIADRLGIFIAKKIVNDEKLSTSDIMIPVPLHPARKRERGYNQSDLIANSISRELGIKNESHLLERTRQTQTQTSFDAEGRKKNISGAFSLERNPPDSVSGKNILLIDDVITTGSTIRECAKVLKENGAAEVYAASAAITI